MKQTLLIIVAFVLMIAIIFGITVISEMTTSDDSKKGSQPGEKKAVGQVFEFKSQARFYDPDSTEDFHNRYFRGFYEEGDEDAVNFGFVNKSPEPIVITGKASCTSCSGALIANITAAQWDEYAKTMAVGGMVTPGLTLNLLQVGAAMQLDSKLAWETIDVSGTYKQTTLPAGKAEAQSGYGFLQLRMKPSRTTQQEPYFDLYAGVANEAPTHFKLQLKFMFIPSGFAVRPNEQIDIGELSDANPKKTFEIVTWSPVREFGERFPPQVIKIDDPTAPIIVGAAQPLSPEEIAKLKDQVSSEFKRPMRVAGAFRFPITYQRGKDGQLTEIGPFEKIIDVVGVNNARATLKVFGNNVGFVRLRDSKQIDFGTFEAQYEKSVNTVIVSDRTDVELELLPGETKPRYMKVTLSPPETEDGRRSWKLNVRIEAKQGYGALPKDAVVAFRTVGPNPVTLKIPVTGTGIRR